MTQIKMAASHGSNLLTRPLKTTLLADTLRLNNRLARRVKRQAPTISMQALPNSQTPVISTGRLASQQNSAISMQYQHHSNLSVLSRHHKQ